jgi:N-carbamoyl-L-amino-acid hydrolase
MTQVTINSARLAATIEEISSIGAIPGGGCCRLALTDEDRQARDLFVAWCKAADAEVTIDCFGNIFAFRRGRSRTRKVVLTGSHLDTQPHGGRLDGVYGVLAGLEVIRTLNDHGIETEFDIAVANWTNEEGVRFAPGLTGSSGFSGSIPRGQIMSLKSAEGPTFEEELTRIGYDGVPTPDLDIKAYIEAHIEQGPVLESKGATIGIVQGIQEVRWFEVTVVGSDRHAGTTPMHLRQDSFMATTSLVSAMRDICAKLDDDIRFTVGRVDVSPGSPNTVPGISTFTIDLRHPDSRLLDEVVERFYQLTPTLDYRERVKTTITSTMLVPAVSFDETCIATVDAAARKAGFVAMTIVSGAMHDASRMASIAPTSMIFVPSRDGISHHESEWTDPVHLAAGCQVLLETLLALAR